MSVTRSELFWGADGVYKFGSNADIDSGAVPADIWRGPTLTYPFPSTASVTTLVSDNAGDAIAGAGARTVKVEGLSDEFLPQSEEIETDGVTPVQLTKPYLRVHRAYVTSVGGDPSGTNLGNIDVLHGATVIARIASGIGQTLLGIYTIPKLNRSFYLVGWEADLSGASNGQVSLSLQSRLVDGAWRTINLGSVARDQSLFRNIQIAQRLPYGTDIRVRATSASANNLAVTTIFQLLQR